MSKSRNGLDLPPFQILHHSEHTLGIPLAIYSSSIAFLELQKPAVSHQNHSAESKSKIWLQASNGSVKKVKMEVSKVSTHSFSQRLHDLSLSRHNSATMTRVSESRECKSKLKIKHATTKKPRSPDRKAKPSIIFENPQRTPITITLTAPDDERSTKSKQQRNTFKDIRSIRNSCPPHKPLAKPPVQNIDKTLLIPQALDTRHMQNLEDSGEIRGFMIDFMNIKGDTFPAQLRVQMMALYGIQETDLHAEMVAKFKAPTEKLQEDHDCVVVYGCDMESPKANLKILETAFHSRIGDMTPTQITTTTTLCYPPQATLKHKSKPRDPSTTLRDRSYTPFAMADADREIMPLAYTAPSPRPRSLSKARSMPNLRSVAPTGTSSIPGTGDRGKERERERGDDGRAGRLRRGGLLGAFGSVREAWGRKKAGKS